MGETVVFGTKIKLIDLLATGCVFYTSGDKYGCNIKIILEEGTKKQYLLKLTLQWISFMLN
jgi:hypothetical protein